MCRNVYVEVRGQPWISIFRCYLLGVFEIVFHCSELTDLGRLPGHQDPEEPPVSVSPVMGSQACATTPGSLPMGAGD